MGDLVLYMEGRRQFGLFEAQWPGKGRWCDFGYGSEADLSWALDIPPNHGGRAVIWYPRLDIPVLCITDIPLATRRRICSLKAEAMETVLGCYYNQEPNPVAKPPDFSQHVVVTKHS